jgi:GWxTD domain-containing protein
MRRLVGRFCIVPLLLLFAALAGCGPTTEADRLAAGKTRAYQAGTPEFDIESVPVWTDTATAVDIYIRIPHSSLTFTTGGKGFEAVAEIIAQLLDPHSRGQVVERYKRVTLSVKTFPETVGDDASELVVQLPASAGDYQLAVELEDLNSRKQTRREESLTVIGRTPPVPALGKMVIEERREGGEFRPLLRLHVPADCDSLRLALPLYHMPVGESADLLFSLFRLRCDTSAAQAPYGFGPIAGTYKWSYVDFARPETLRSQLIPILGTGLRQVLREDLERLPEGMYECTAEVRRIGERKQRAPLIARRYLMIFPPHFPRPVEIDQLIEPLRYIAKEQEMDSLRAAGTPEERRVRMEKFWLEKMPDLTSARATVNRYYQRVLEANRLFTTYKEGWKTDRGMIYIVLGAPLAIQRQFENERWEYDLSRTVYENFYTFRRIIIEGEEAEVRGYVLVRSSAYEQFWFDMLDRWRRGNIF